MGKVYIHGQTVVTMLEFGTRIVRMGMVHFILGQTYHHVQAGIVVKFPLILIVRFLQRRRVHLCFLVSYVRIHITC